MGVEDEVVAAADAAADAVEEAVENVEEVVEEAVEDVESSSESAPVTVVVESDGSEAESLNESIDAVERIRAIAREEAAAAASAVLDTVPGIVAGAIAEHEVTAQHGAQVIITPPSADDDAEPPQQHPWFRPIGRGR